MIDFSARPIRRDTSGPLQSFSRAIWIGNIALFIVYLASSSSFHGLFSSVVDYHNVTSDPFDGAVPPIAYVPNWLDTQVRSDQTYSDMSIDRFVPIPAYEDALSGSHAPDAALAQRVFPTVYMGSYRGNHTEYDGSHVGIDIRAPEGTPIVAIANGVIVRAQELEQSSGKYVVIRHDRITYRGREGTYYSAYLHMSEIVTMEGMKIKKGDIIGRVGSTGISTAPHLEFQIDTEDAPFHAYWPFTFREIADLGVDFFAAINMGVGKDKAMRYSVSPMSFIREASVPSTLLTSASNNTKNIAVASDTLHIPTTPVTVLSTTGVSSSGMNTPAITHSRDPYASIPTVWKVRVAALVKQGVIMPDSPLDPMESLSRREAIILLTRAFRVPSESHDTGIESVFIDVPFGDTIVPSLRYATERGIIGRNSTFRPDDTITRAEFVKMFIGFSGIPLLHRDRSPCRDVAKDSDFVPYITAFMQVLELRGSIFHPEKPLNRGEGWNIIAKYLSR